MWFLVLRVIFFGRALSDIWIFANHQHKFLKKQQFFSTARKRLPKPYFLQGFLAPLKKAKNIVKNKVFSPGGASGRPENLRVLCDSEAPKFHETGNGTPTNTKLGSGAKKCCFFKILCWWFSKITISLRALRKKITSNTKNRTPPQASGDILASSARRFFKKCFRHRASEKRAPLFARALGGRQGALSPA